MKQTALKRVTPMVKKRAKARTTKSAQCSRQRCSHPARSLDLCASHLEAEADALFSRAVRGLGRCLGAEGDFWSGSYFTCRGPLQCAHLVSRRYHATRWNPSNAVCLCASHHRWMDTHPLEKDIICARWLGGREWEDMKTLAMQGESQDPAVVIGHYRRQAG